MNFAHVASVAVDDQYARGVRMVQCGVEGSVPVVDGMARAFWVREPGVGEIRVHELPPRGEDDVLVRTLFSGVSRGTESLVFRGAVPPSQFDVMRAPFQGGEFPGPVKYGYLNVGTVEDGPAGLRGRTVFCLYPHQTAYVVPAGAVHLVPADVPPRRAVLAGAVETALNALWDCAPLIGDRVGVVGGGMVGCCVARLLTRIPGVDVTLIDLEAARADTAAALGVRFAHPDDARGGQDLVVHTSASATGLNTSLNLLAPEGRVVELSWYGDTDVSIRLGEAFHSRRLGIQASQVGTVSPRLGRSRTTRERMTLALELLADPAFDAILTGTSRFDELPELMPALVSGRSATLCHTISYEEG